MTTKRMDREIDQTSVPLVQGPERSTASAATVKKLTPRTKRLVHLGVRTGIKAGGAGWE